MVAFLSSSEQKFNFEESMMVWPETDLVCLHLDLGHLGGPGHPVPGHRHLDQQPG